MANDFKPDTGSMDKWIQDAVHTLVQTIDHGVMEGSKDVKAGIDDVIKGLSSAISFVNETVTQGEKTASTTPQQASDQSRGV